MPSTPDFLPGRVPLVDLEDHHCRWIAAKDELTTYFCGRHKNIGSYCNEHAARVYARMVVNGHENAKAATKEANAS